jgi:hypothetical protein
LNEIYNNNIASVLYPNNSWKEMDNICLKYTSETGNTEDFQNINNLWNNKNIFCSPTIQYGLSYDIPETHHIFSYCHRNTSTAFDNMQQANRIRHPLSYHIFISMKEERRNK